MNSAAITNTKYDENQAQIDENAEIAKDYDEKQVT